MAASACGGDGDLEGADPSDTTTAAAGNGTDEGNGVGDGLETDLDGLDTDPTFDGPITVAVPNSPGTLTTGGRQRVMTALIGDGPNAFLGGPDQPVVVRFEHVDGDTVGEVEGAWLTTNAAALGLYVTYYEFPAAGLWEVIVSADGEDLGAALIEVTEESAVPNIGDPAPKSVTPTGTTVAELAAISTDPEPDPSLYDLTIADAVTNGRPTVIVFATPAFCQTALCGPTLETVKAAGAGRDDIDLVHIEPFDLELAPQGTLQPIGPMADWGLVTEPWVFVVDADGLVSATFEGIIGQEELEAALAVL